MSTFKYFNRGDATVRFAIALLALAGTGYVAEALVQNPITSRGAPDRLVKQTAPPPSRATNISHPPRAAGSNRHAGDQVNAPDEQIAQPRECDLPRGIATDCLFLD